MKSKSVLIVFASLLFILMGCKNEMFPEPESSGDALKSSNAKIKIAVISDIHYMSPELIPSDVAGSTNFKNYLRSDANKLVELSDPIFRQTLEELKAENPDIIMIPGDLSCDGQLTNHQIVREMLDELAGQGTKIFVVPGNNDIKNNNSKSYANDVPVVVPNIDATQFASIYAPFGYTETARDPNSLTYIAKPYSHLWILGIDACKYSPSYRRSGVIKTATLDWIKTQLTEAKENGIDVIAVMHHNLMEHFTKNITLNPSVVLDNWKLSLNTLADLGVKLVFTGHNHANDIVKGVSDIGNVIYDIETGSLITAPSPYRIMILDDNFIKIDTRNITQVDYNFPEGQDFVSYSNNANFERLNYYYTNTVLPTMFGVLPVVATEASPYVIRATMAYNAGDEWLSPEEKKSLYNLALFPGMTTDLHNGISSFWIDLPPKDNKLHIKLK